MCVCGGGMGACQGRHGQGEVAGEAWAGRVWYGRRGGGRCRIGGVAEQTCGEAEGLIHLSVHFLRFPLHLTQGSHPERLRGVPLQI